MLTKQVKNINKVLSCGIHAMYMLKHGNHARSILKHGNLARNMLSACQQHVKNANILAT